MQNPGRDEKQTGERRGERGPVGKYFFTPQSGIELM